jgi:hypothetical protein
MFKNSGSGVLMEKIFLCILNKIKLSKLLTLNRNVFYIEKNIGRFIWKPCTFRPAVILKCLRIQAKNKQKTKLQHPGQRIKYNVCGRSTESTNRKCFASQKEKTFSEIHKRTPTLTLFLVTALTIKSANTFVMMLYGSLTG